MYKTTWENVLFIKRWFSGIASSGRPWLAFLIPVESVQAHGKSQSVQDLVFNGAQQRFQLLRFRADASRAQVGMTGYRPGSNFVRFSSHEIFSSLPLCVV